MSRTKGPNKERIYAYVLPSTNDAICREAVRRKMNVGEYLDWLINSVKLENLLQSPTD